MLCNENIALVFGTDTGKTEKIGNRIAMVLRQYGYAVDVINVTEITGEVLAAYHFLIMGIPTGDFGGIQEDWEDIRKDLMLSDLRGRVVALYGLGSQRKHGDYFVDAMGWLHSLVVQAGADVIGQWPTTGYKFSASLAANEQLTEFCGLAIDEEEVDNEMAGEVKEYKLTDVRIKNWIALILDQFEKMPVLFRKIPFQIEQLSIQRKQASIAS